MSNTLSIIKEAQQLRDTQGKAAEAIKILKPLGEEIKDDPLLSYDYPMILKKIGTYYFDLGQTERSRKYLLQALERAKTDLNKIETADIRCSLASLELYTGSLDKALEYILRAWKYIGKKRGEKFVRVRVNTNIVLGNIYFEQGKYPESLKKYQTAFRNAESANYIGGLITAVVELAKYQMVVKEKFVKAEKLLKEHLDKMQESYKIMLPHYFRLLAEISLERQDLEEARATAKKALKFAERNRLLRGIARVNEVLGQIYSGSKPEKADACFKKALDAYNDGGYNMPTEHPKEEDWYTDFDE